MILDQEFLAPLIAQARLAPSVHNVQPARWGLKGGQLSLLGDPACAIPIADPSGRDWRLSVGAHFEGMSLAAAARALVVEHSLDTNPGQTSQEHALIKIGDVRFRAASQNDELPKAQPIETRASWRGAFQQGDGAAAERLQQELPDCTVVTDRDAIQKIARLADRAALHFLRDQAHRAELLQWLRLSRKHPRFDLDGLNADAMNMSVLESWGAGLVLGPLFDGLDRIGLAAPLVNEAAKTATAGAIILFHRPNGEDAFTSGRAFYHCWLSIERAGLSGCPMSVLADWPEARMSLASDYAVPEDREIVSVMRVGMPKGRRSISHARLSVDQLLVTAAA